MLFHLPFISPPFISHSCQIRNGGFSFMCTMKEFNKLQLIEFLKLKRTIIGTTDAKHCFKILPIDSFNKYSSIMYSEPSTILGTSDVIVDIPNWVLIL